MRRGQVSNAQSAINSISSSLADTLLVDFENIGVIDTANGFADRGKEDRRSDTNPHGYVDIMTFCEDPYYIGLRLFPQQRVILKAFYGGTAGNRHLKLSCDEERLCSNCVWKDNGLTKLKSPCLHCQYHNDEERDASLKHQLKKRNLSKEEYEKFIATSEFTDRFQNEIDLVTKDLEDLNNGEEVSQQILRKLGLSFSELVLVLGRRSGKSFLTAMIALYEAYRLIEIGDPHTYYGIGKGDLITIINVAASKKQALDAVFEKIKNFSLNSPYFQKRINGDSVNMNSMRLFTDVDLELTRQRAEVGLPPHRGSIEIFSGTSNSASQVGKTCAVVIIDEVAAMIQDEESKMSDQQLYDLLEPSCANFAPDGKVILISNPKNKDGLLWDKYCEGLTSKASPLVFQLPTLICNPSVEKAEILEKRDKNPATWLMQYGAEFAEGAADPAILPEVVNAAFVPDRDYRVQGITGIDYYAHADPATKSDMYSFVILHTEATNMMDENGKPKQVVVVDHVKLWIPDRERGIEVDISLVDEYIIQACRDFKIVSLTYDQWNSASSLQKLQKLGLPVEQTTFNPSYKATIYQELIDHFNQGLVEIYDSGPFLFHVQDQLKSLTKKFTSRRKMYLAQKGKHDDIPDCIAGAAYRALNRKNTSRYPRSRSGKIGLDPASRQAGRGAAMAPMTGYNAQSRGGMQAYR